MLKFFRLWLGTFLTGCFLFCFRLFLFSPIKKVFSIINVDISARFIEFYDFTLIILISLLPTIISLDMIIRFFKNDNPFNSFRSLYLTLRLRRLLDVAYHKVEIIDDNGQEVKVADVSQHSYLHATGYLTVNRYQNRMIFKIKRPINYDAQKQLQKRLEGVRSELSNLVPDLVLSAVKSEKKHYIILGETHNKG